MASPKPNKEFVVPIIPAEVVLDGIPMRAYCAGAVFEAHVRPTVEGVKEFRESVLEALSLEASTHPTMLVGIPGGKA